MSHASHIHITTDLPTQLNDLLSINDRHSSAFFLCDTNTYAAGGEWLHKTMPDDTSLLNLGLQVKPTLQRARGVASKLSNASCLVVFGSGTLTDIAKYAAFSAQIPCISIPSAASMNGYASSTASLIDEHGHKTSHLCASPTDILVDNTRIARAPIALTQAGIGDTLCRSSVQADALLSHALTGSWYDADYFAALRAIEELLVKDIACLHVQDASYIAQLMQALLLSGAAMQKAGSSMPASAGEHMIAHHLETIAPLQMRDHYHGAHIAVTSLTMARLQQFMIQREMIFDTHRYETQFHAIATSAATHNKLKQLKTISPEAFAHAWQHVKHELAESLLPADILDATLAKAGLATDCEGLGILRADYVEAVRTAFATRDRITFLDLVAMRP